MIVQACINGARAFDFHPALPLSTDKMARDGEACVAAGAAELHLHPRDLEGRESLAPATMDATMLAVRRACPGTLIGVSTGAWIEADERRTLACIDGWNELPDYASVNLEERDAPAVMERLRQRGIGIEAGLASVADARAAGGLRRSQALPAHPHRGGRAGCQRGDGRCQRHRGGAGPRWDKAAHAAAWL